MILLINDQDEKLTIMLIRVDGCNFRDPYANQKRRRETDKVYDEQAGSMHVDPRKVDQG